MDSKETKPNKSRLKWLKRLFLVIVAMPVVLLMLLDAVLSDFVLQKVVDRVISQYVDGSVDIGRIKVSALRNFPNLRIELRDVDITYPHSRFESFPNDTERLSLAGTARDPDSLAQDTLAHADVVMAAINVLDFARHEYNLPHIELCGFKGYLHRYDSTATNWGMFRFESDTNASETTFPEFQLGRVVVDERPTVVYTDRPLGIYAELGFDELTALGRFDMQLLDKLYSIGSRPERSRLRLKLSGLDFSAKLLGEQGRDSLGFALEYFSLEEHQNHIDIGLNSEAALKLNGSDLLSAPLELDTEIGFPPVPDGALASFDILDFSARVAALPLKLAGKADLYADRMDMDLSANIEGCSIGEIINEYIRPFVPSSRYIKTDADINLEAHAQGVYAFDGSRLPVVNALLTVPDSHFSYAKVITSSEFDMTLKALLDEEGQLSANLEDFCFSMKGLSLNVKGASDNLLAEDPRISMDGNAHAALEKLVAYLPADSGIKAQGNVDLILKGAFRPSQLSMYKLSSSELQAVLKGERVMLAMPADTLYANLGQAVVRLDNGRYTAALDTLSLTIGEALRAQGAKLRAQAVHSADTLSNGLPQLEIALDANSVDMQSGKDLELMLRGSRNHFSMRKGSGSAPVIKAATAGNAFILNMGEHRVLLRNASADLNTRARVRRARTERSSRNTNAERRDSTRARFSADSSRLAYVPDFLTEKDFKLKDINIKLDSTLLKLYRTYNPYGSLKISTAKIVTPMLPLRTSADSLNLIFDDNSLTLNSLGVTAGTSSLSAKGNLRGLRQAFQGRGAMTLDVDLNASRLNVNELMAAFQFAAADTVKHEVIADNRAYQNSIVIDTLVNAEVGLDMPLIVVPSNLIAKMRMSAGEVNISNFDIKGLASDLTMRERTVQLLNTMLLTEVGNASFDAFYSTRTKNDIKAGFNLALSDVTAAKVTEIFPVVDSIVPMLKSFKGLLNMEMAATTRLDTNMNLILPSIDGIVKLDGHDLVLEDTGNLRRMAKLLMFKDSKVGHIDDMAIYGIISNNKLDIYPFLLGVDRYTLALFGQQKFDSNFDYHISIVEAPLPFRFSLNLKGDFNDWNYSIGRSKYRNRKLPKILPIIDDMQSKLSTSIRDIFTVGVDEVVRANESVRREAQRRGDALLDEGDDSYEMLEADEMAELDSMMLDYEIEKEQEALEAEIESLLEDLEFDF